MRYDFGRMEPITFEALSQSLFQGILGPTCKIYGAGPDGQREAVCNREAVRNIESLLNICGNPTVGKTFLQAKYKGQQTMASDLTWLKRELKVEFDGLSEKKKTEPEYLPQNIFFFTNVILTPVKDKGIKDKIDKYIEQFKVIIPNIYVIGYDEICSMLDNNAGVRQAYFCFLVSGDVLHALYEWMVNSQEQPQKALYEAILRYYEIEFKSDMYSRLEQAGYLRNTGIRLEQVFVDLEISPMSTKEKDDRRFVSNMISIGNQPLRKPTEQQSANNRFVLLGGAGQGKSTLGQFLVQIYRAHLLNMDKTCKASDQVNSFTKRFIENYKYEIKCARMPIRIILKDYAAWIMKNPDSSCSVLDYITNQINTKASAKCNTNELREFMKTSSWVFIFDGLDEVPTSSNRANMLEHILAFIDIELRRIDCDALIIATSRPQGYNEEFSDSIYTHLSILEMSTPICIEYLYKLIEQMEPSYDERKKKKDILTESLKDPVISKLTQRPLHASIVAILVHSGGEPPRDKYALFKEYTDIIMKRERQKNISPTLDKFCNIITKTHEEAAYVLQEASSKPGNPAAVFLKSEIILLITRKLAGDSIGCIDTDEINEIYELMAQRLCFLSEVRDNEVGFSIRSVQEFFAANYLIKHRAESEIIGIIRRIAHSGYWRNVLVFVVSYCIKEREHLECTVDSTCGELNGSELEPADYDANKGSQIGAWVAFSLLCENIFANTPKYENKYIKHAANLFNLSYVAPLLGKIVELPPDSLNKLLESYLKPVMIQFPNSKSTWKILWHLVLNYNQSAIELAKTILEQHDADINKILLYYPEDSPHIFKKAEWLAPFCIDWLRSGNCLLRESSKILYSSIIAEEIEKNMSDTAFRASLVKSFLIAVADNHFGFPRIDAYVGFRYNRLFSLLSFRSSSNELYSIGHLSFFTPNMNLSLHQLDLLKSIKTVCHELELIFFERWSGFLLSPSPVGLRELIKAYYMEDKSIRHKLKPYFSSFFPLRIVFIDCLENEMSEDDVYQYLDDNYPTLLSDLSNELGTVEKERAYLRKNKNSRIYKYLSYSVTRTEAALQYFISDFDINPDMIGNYAEGFISILLFVAATTIREISKIIEKSNIIEGLTGVIDAVLKYYQNRIIGSRYRRNNLCVLSIFYIACIHPSNIPELKYTVFQDEDAVRQVYYYDIDKEIYSIALTKILKRILFDEKEHDALKIVLYIMYRGIGVDVNDADIVTVKRIRCSNVYNELGRLLICLFDKSKDSQIDFVGLSYDLDILFIADCVATAVNTIGIPTDAARNSICSLYKEIKGRYKKTDDDNIYSVVTKLEKAMYELSSNSACTPL